jgi:hypothetical protein
MGVGGLCHATAALPPGRAPVPIMEEACWAPGPAWTGVEKRKYLASTGFEPRTVQPAASRSQPCRHFNVSVPSSYLRVSSRPSHDFVPVI